VMVGYLQNSVSRPWVRSLNNKFSILQHTIKLIFDLIPDEQSKFEATLSGY